MRCPRFAGREVGVDLPGPGKLSGVVRKKDGTIVPFGRAVDDRLVVPDACVVGDKVAFTRSETADDSGDSFVGVVTKFTADELVVEAPKPKAETPPKEAPKA